MKPFAVFDLFSLQPRRRRADPTRIPGLAAWYDARFLGLADGDPVGVMPELSGRLPDMVQNDTARKPTFFAQGPMDMGACIWVDGVDDWISTPFFSFGDLLPDRTQFTVITVAAFSALANYKWPQLFGHNGHKTISMRAGDTQDPDYPMYLHGEVGKPPYDGSNWTGVSKKSANAQYIPNVPGFAVFRGDRGQGDLFRLDGWFSDGRSDSKQIAAFVNDLAPGTTSCFLSVPASKQASCGPFYFARALVYDRYLTDEEVEYLRHV